MIKVISRSFYTGWKLLRFIAVASSSIATILSSMLPIFSNTDASVKYLLFMLVFLSMGAVLVHGVLTHLFNDYTDFKSGTDAHSPAILSGGSRVIQKGLMRPHIMWKLGKWLALTLLAIGGLLAVMKQYKLTILLVVGVWGAASYSLPSIRLSYMPFLGEWLSLFPAMFFLGIAGPWIMLDTIPIWAVQNAIINALICMSWVMVHHIPDIEADRQAIPVKRTTVVWFAEKLDITYVRFPAFLYMFLASLCMIWVSIDRPFAALLSLIMAIIALILIFKTDPKNLQQVTSNEKIMLLLAVITALVLGIF